MPHARLAALAASLIAFASQATAQGLEDCVVPGANSPLICVTALEFGAQAAFIRDTLTDDMSGTTSTAKLGDREWYGVAGINAQRTSGNFTGDAAHLLLAASTPLSDTFQIGALVQTGRGSVTAPLSPEVSRQEILVGPYFTSQLGNGDGVTGYVLYGRPEYEITNTTTTGETFIGSLIWSRSIERDGVDFAPFAALSSKTERPDGSNQIDAHIATFGTGINGDVVQTSYGLRQLFGKVEMDVGTYSDSFGADVNYTAPRIGFGSRYAFSSGGSLQVQGNASFASDETTIGAVQIMYQFDF